MILFILLDLLICLIYALVLIWLGLENWYKRSVSPFIGATLPCVTIFLRGAARVTFRINFYSESFSLWLLVC